MTEATIQRELNRTRGIADRQRLLKQLWKLTQALEPERQSRVDRQQSNGYCETSPRVERPIDQGSLKA